MTYPNAHQIASTFDGALMRLAAGVADAAQERRLQQAELAAEARARTAVAGRSVRHAVERQRAHLVETLREAATLRAEAVALRSENTRLKAELARMRSRALEAEGRLVRLGKETAARRAA